MCCQVDKMVLLVLGCAVTCPGRAEHISVILDMEDIKVISHEGQPGFGVSNENEYICR